jgi:galactose mutarotase-like enzyme
MDAEIRNDRLSARVAETGSELKGLTDLSTGTEHIWKGDPAWWSGSAPVLFPIVGGLKDGRYRLGGATYEMPQHGLVRKKPWSLVSSGGAEAVFETRSDDATRPAYPFEFVLRAGFRLEGRGLDVRYEVTNAGGGVMYFSIGSHPALNVPFAGGSLENYYLHFSESEDLPRYFFADGMHLNETEPVFDNSRQIFLTRTLFDRGAIILKGPRSKSVTIMRAMGPRRVRVSTDGMPFLGIWSKPGAPFVCVEPWHGIPDNVDTDQDFTTKEGIMTLAAGATYTTGYRIDIMDGPEV